ncbi:ABC transporter ATP-binding protein [Lentzea tibetensis]|uniref:ABC transporter ATP-binding protein n=1 Tax=Lentzea tibetensis TaxID=2591470 RepID=A0A563EJU4_9PSEU|nr:ABC transporter ATP-binding protein [Lentzea tibetensis]TWP47309.1 ABC transporter ATP-binding protein [Lentzea tibetensis]
MTRELLPIASGARTWAVLRSLAPVKLTLLAFGVLVAGTGAGMVAPPVLGHVVDLVTARRDEFLLPVAVLVVVALLQGGLTALGISLVAKVGEGVLAELRERFVTRVLRLPLEQVEKAGAGDLTSRVTRDVQVVADAVRIALPTMARASLTIVLTLVGLLVLDWRFLLAALLAAPIQAYTVRWYGGRAMKVYTAQRTAVGEQQQQLLDTIGGASTVRAFRLGEDHLSRVRTRSEAAVSLTLRGIKLLSQFYGRLNVAEVVGLVGVLVTGFILVGNGSATLGTATAAALYFHSLFNPINQALALADDVQSATASLSRIVGVVDCPVPDRGTFDGVADGSVKVSGVGHSYVTGRPVLSDVDIDLSPGERVALVGASGAGKTTLAKLIAGVHTPSAGTVDVGGDPRDSVALISQEVHVFAGPLIDDLRLARPSASVDEVEAALARVDALAWASALPSGLSTVVGEGGHRLTVAQAQQLALARLVLADRPVAILDEATADAGSAGARALEAAASSALEGRTGLLVAHRLTQAESADRVVVLEDGRVVESGTHADLLAAGGKYATLWAAWSGSR